jgi:serine/threonine-protein kinase RsbW
VVETRTGSHPFEDREEILRAQIPSVLAERESLIERALASLKGAGCAINPFFDRLFLDEIISNAILHGNRQDPAKLVTLRVFSSGKERFGFEVEDQGAGFDFRKALSRGTNPKAEDLLQENGRGIGLIAASGAEIHFLDGGRRVVVVRKAAKAETG